MKTKLTLILFFALACFLAATATDDIDSLIDKSGQMPDSLAILQLSKARELARDSEEIEKEIQVQRLLFDRYNRIGDQQKAVKVIDRIFELYRLRNEQVSSDIASKRLQMRFGIFAGLALFIAMVVVMVGVLLNRNKHHLNARKEIEKTNHRLNETMSKLEAASPHDAVTGLISQRAMLERIQYEEIRFERSQMDFTYILCEIDDYEDLKIEHGMQTAEYILRTIGDMIRESVRKQDIIGRWSDARYLFLLPQTNPQGASVIAEKIRGKIESNTYQHRHNNLSVTLTFGIAAYDPKKGSRTCIAEAEQALVQGKTQGMNQVVVYVPAE